MAHFLPSGAIWLMLVAESLGPVPRHGLEELAKRFERNFLVNIVVLHLLGLALLTRVADFLEDQLHDLDLVVKGHVPVS